MKVVIFFYKMIRSVDEGISQEVAMPSNVTHSCWFCDEEGSWSRYAN